MRNVKHDKKATNAVMAALDKAARKSGILLVKYAASKWVSMQASKARLLKTKATLEKELAEVERGLKRR